MSAAGSSGGRAAGSVGGRAARVAGGRGRGAGRVAGVLVAGALAASLLGCSGGDDRPPAAAVPSSSALAVSPSGAPGGPGGSASPSPTAAPRPPEKTTDGCKGLLTPAQAARATGLPLVAGTGDAAAAAQQYAQVLQGQGSPGTVRLCPFSSPQGDQISVLAIAYADPGAARKVYQSAVAGMPAAKPVPGIGEEAVGDGGATVVARRGATVVVVAATAGPGDRSAAVAALAGLALGAR